MDEHRKALKGAIADAGMSLAEVSRAIGRKSTYIYQYLNRNVPKKLDGDDRRKLSEILGIAEDRIGGEEPPMRPIRGKPIPVMGRADCGNGLIAIDADPVDFIERPPMLFGVEEAYAAEISGTSMEPRYRAGEVAIVNPRRAYARGDDVVVQLMDGTAMLKTYESGEDEIVLSQLNPAKKITLKVEDVRAIHKVVINTLR